MFHGFIGCDTCSLSLIGKKNKRLKPSLFYLFIYLFSNVVYYYMSMHTHNVVFFHPILSTSCYCASLKRKMLFF